MKILLCLVLLSVAACARPRAINVQGPAGAPGQNGAPGAVGPAGTPGTPGEAGVATFYVCNKQECTEVDSSLTCTYKEPKAHKHDETNHDD